MGKAGHAVQGGAYVRTRSSRLLPPLATAILLTACGSADGGHSTTFTFSGVSFAGDAHLLYSYGGAAGVPDPTSPLSASFADRLEGVAYLTVQVIVPAQAWTGPGTYHCGTEPAHYLYDQAYCTIEVRQCTPPDPIGAVCGDWATWLTPRPDHTYGALPRCTVTIVDAGSRLRGSLACAGLAFGGEGTHPDAGRMLDLTGSFDVSFAQRR